MPAKRSKQLKSKSNIKVVLYRVDNRYNQSFKYIFARLKNALLFCVEKNLIHIKKSL